jgi:hypothetical protein
MLCSVVEGLTVEFWLRATREERDAIYEAKLWLAEREQARKARGGGG